MQSPDREPADGLERRLGAPVGECDRLACFPDPGPAAAELDDVGEFVAGRETLVQHEVDRDDGNVERARPAQVDDSARRTGAQSAVRQEDDVVRPEGCAVQQGVHRVAGARRRQGEVGTEVAKAQQRNAQTDGSGLVACGAAAAHPRGGYRADVVVGATPRRTGSFGPGPHVPTDGRGSAPSTSSLRLKASDVPKGAWFGIACTGRANPDSRPDCATVRGHLWTTNGPVDIDFSPLARGSAATDPQARGEKSPGRSGVADISPLARGSEAVIRKRAGKSRGPDPTLPPAPDVDRV